MKRDMSYELDGVFSNRGAGELVQVKPARTRIGRAPGLQQQRPASQGRNISAPFATAMHEPHPRNITAHNTKSLAHGLGKPLNAAFYNRANDLAGDEDLACDDGDMGMGMGDMDAGDPMPGMGDITLPFIGPVSKTGMVIAGIAGLIAWKMFKRA